MSNNKPGHNYEFFSHTSCEFFPCHPTHTPEGVKDCSACLLPHRRENYSYIVGKLMEGGEKP